MEGRWVACKVVGLLDIAFVYIKEKIAQHDNSPEHDSPLAYSFLVIIIPMGMMYPQVARCTHGKPEQSKQG